MIALQSQDVAIPYYPFRYTVQTGVFFNFWMALKAIDFTAHVLHHYTPRPTKLEGGVYWNQLVCPSVCLSVCQIFFRMQLLSQTCMDFSETLHGD